MLDNLYTDIGTKIKNLAKSIFIIEAIGAVITGIALLAADDDFILAGLLTLFCGPIVALVLSWILYAFGERVEDVHAIRNNEGTVAEGKAIIIQSTETRDNLRKATQCECGELHYAKYCPICGKKAGASI